MFVSMAPARRVVRRAAFVIIGAVTPENAPSALTDIRVLDLAGEIGQYCTKLLADLGADVIKIEPPEGDPVRNLPPFYRDEPRARARASTGCNLNTNKRSMTLRYRKRGRARRRSRSSWRRRMSSSRASSRGTSTVSGLGYEGLSKIKPDIILTSITGFGQTGPHAKYKAPDIVGVAMGGTMWLAGEPQDPPNVPPWKQGYISASIIGAAGTLLALCHRDVTGEGQHVDVSMQEALSLDAGDGDADMGHAAGAALPERLARRHPGRHSGHRHL